MKIPILHLENGLHHFEGTIKTGTFHFYHDENFPNDIEVKIELNKFDKNITCSVELKTKAEYICDRCLSRFTREHHGSFEVLFHMGPKDFETDEDDVIMLSPEQKEIDLNTDIQENLALSVPMKALCREDCKGICPGCGADLNHEKCTCGDKPADPRWEKLLELKK